MTALQRRHDADGGADNPFPSVPEVRLGRTAARVRIDTAAVVDVRRIAQDFLTARAGPTSDAPARSGRVVAILGDYGTGKSHLAAELVDAVIRIQGVPALILFESALNGDTFFSLYQRLLGPVGSGTERRILPLDTAGGTLQFAAVEEMVAEFCSERDAADPAVARVWRRHERLLQAAGRDEELATALGLLVHRTAAWAAWRWIAGRDLPADDRRLLAERGVVSPPIEGDRRATAALRAVARLSAGTGRPLMLVLDEVHQLRPSDEGGRTAAADVLMGLANWAGDSGALLAVCGLMDAWQALPGSVRGRVTMHVRPAPLTLDETGAYIRAALRGAEQGADEAPASPFTDEAVKELKKITGGHPRRTIGICHHAYAAFRGTGSIGPRQIQEASRKLRGPVTAEEVKDEIGGWCAELGLRAERPQSRGHGRADLRVSAGGRDAECLLVVSGPVVERKECAALVARARRLAGGGHAGREPGVVLVVVGLLGDEYREEVGAAFAHVLFWEDSRCRDKLEATLRSRLALGEQAGLRQLVADLAGQVRALRADLASGTTRDPGPSTDSGAGAGPDRQWRDPARRALYDDVTRHCEEALAALDGTEGVRKEFWRGRFLYGQPYPMLRYRNVDGFHRAALLDVLDKRMREARGTQAFLEDALGVFTVRVQDLLRDERRPLPDLRDEVKYLADKFDGSVREMINRFPEDTNGAARRLMGVDREWLRRHLGGLGATVYSAFMNAET